MTDPQPHHLKQKPPRAEPWQPDRPGADVEEGGHDDTAARQATPTKVVQSDGPQDTDSAVSPEAAIPRDPQTGQALNDRSLTSGKDSERSDGRSGSMHLPES